MIEELKELVNINYLGCNYKTGSKYENINFVKLILNDDIINKVINICKKYNYILHADNIYEQFMISPYFDILFYNKCFHSEFNSYNTRIAYDNSLKNIILTLLKTKIISSDIRGGMLKIFICGIDDYYKYIISEFITFIKNDMSIETLVDKVMNDEKLIVYFAITILHDTIQYVNENNYKQKLYDNINRFVNFINILYRFDYGIDLNQNTYSMVNNFKKIFKNNIIKKLFKPMKLDIDYINILLTYKDSFITNRYNLFIQDPFNIDQYISDLFINICLYINDSP